MNIKAADNLAPIRDQIDNLVSSNSRVIELGCGNGDLLFKLAPKIKTGLGIDKSQLLITSAMKRKEQYNLQNIDFMQKEIGEDYLPPGTWDISIASLFFHVVPPSDAIFILDKFKEVSNEIIICGFCRPESFSQSILLWLDQRFSMHFKNFVSYKKHGYMEGILAEARCSSILTHNTYLPFLKIYQINCAQ
ncbi:MAG TPA: class I SAM-dependent methyltransferase [Pedobacter sp.]|jgi:SAM-dependent methyltransferase